MSTRPFTRNAAKSNIIGVTDLGTMSIGLDPLDYSANPGGLTWWMGPEESTGYIIGAQVPAANQSTPVGSVGNMQFWRTADLTDSSFTSLANYIKRISGGATDLATASAASLWLTTNGYYSTWKPASIVTNNLFMKLDATNYTSGAWADESGNGNNATVTSGTWSSTNGGIFYLNGSSSKMTIPHNSNFSLSTSTQRTIQVWVKFDRLPALDAQIPLLGKVSNSYNFDGYSAGLFSNGGKVQLNTNGASGSNTAESTLTIFKDKWYLFTFISQITGAANTSKVYINGTEYISSSHGTDTYSESNPLSLGYAGDGVGSAYLRGYIGACYFYTTGLSAADVNDNYNATRTKYGM